MEGAILLLNDIIFARCLAISQKCYLNEAYKTSPIVNLYTVNGVENKAMEICHYCTADTLYSILKNECLRFTDVRFLNDSTEFTEAIFLIKEVLNTENYTRGFRDFILESGIIENLEEYRQSYMGISQKTHECIELAYHTYTCSFSVNSNSLNMWNYYATTSTGVNLVFDFAWNIFENSKKTDVNTMNKLENNIVIYRGLILYTLDDKRKCITKLLNDLNIVYEEVKGELDAYKNLILFAFKEAVNHMRCFFKNDHFSCEEEYRVVLKIPEVLLMKKYNDCCGIKENGFFRRGNILIPYIDYKFQHSSIKRITINPYNKGNSMFELGIKELLWTYQLQNVKVVTSNIPIRKY